MFFAFDFKKLILIAVLITVPLLAINIQRKEGNLNIFLKPFFFTSSLLQEGYSDFSRSVRDTTGLYIDLIDIKKDNRELKEQMEQLRAELLQFEDIKNENARLSSLLDFKKASPHHLVAARVIGHDLLGEHSTFFIDKGKKDGIAEGQAVITPDGVAGTILAVEKDFSQVLTVTDKYSEIDSVIERSSARGIVEGASPTYCRLKYLQKTDSVQIGDIAVTTGLDHIFPKGFPIGKIIKVDKKDYGITQSVQLEPFVSSYDVDSVFVVLKTNDQAVEKEKMKELTIKE